MRSHQETTTAHTAATPAESFRQAQKELFLKESLPQQRRATATAATASEAAAIQQSLGRTQKLLRAELQRVAAVQHAIRDDEAMLRKTMDTHQTLNVDKAAHALTQLERAQQKERRLFAAAVAFFWCAVFYVAWCRILIKIPFVDRITGVLPMLLNGVFYGFTVVFGKIMELFNLE